MARFRLYINDKKIGDGVLDIQRTDEARFFGGEGESGCRTLADMERVRMEFAARNGIRLSGFEWTGKHDIHRSKIFRFREWWLAYLPTDEPQPDTKRVLSTSELAKKLESVSRPTKAESVPLPLDQDSELL